MRNQHQKPKNLNKNRKRVIAPRSLQPQSNPPTVHISNSLNKIIPSTYSINNTDNSNNQSVDHDIIMLNKNENVNPNALLQTEEKVSGSYLLHYIIMYPCSTYPYVTKLIFIMSTDTIAKETENMSNNTTNQQDQDNDDDKQINDVSPNENKNQLTGNADTIFPALYSDLQYRKYDFKGQSQAVSDVKYYFINLLDMYIHYVLFIMWWCDAFNK